MSTRRTFLHRFGVGLLGSAAVLLKPAKLLAGFPGQNTVCYPPPVIGFPPVPSMPYVVEPGGGLVAPAAPRKPRTFFGAGDILVHYPPSPPSGETATIPGVGSFCTWGLTTSSLVHMWRIDVQNAAGTSFSFSWSDISSLLNRNDSAIWGFAIEGLSETATFYLVYTYMKANPTGGTTTLTQRYGPYSFVTLEKKNVK